MLKTWLLCLLFIPGPCMAQYRSFRFGMTVPVGIKLGIFERSGANYAPFESIFTKYMRMLPLCFTSSSPLAVQVKSSLTSS